LIEHKKSINWAAGASRARTRSLRSRITPHEIIIPVLGITAGSHPLELDLGGAIKARLVNLNFINPLKRNSMYLLTYCWLRGASLAQW
jgi:hypothetical protein